MHVTADFLVYLVIVDLFLPACALGSQSKVKGYIQSAPSVQDTYHIRLYKANQETSNE